jgi:ATP-dependent protease ClpP protease subunit
MFHLLFAALVLFPNPSFWLNRRAILGNSIAMSLYNNDNNNENNNEKYSNILLNKSRIITNSNNNGEGEGLIRGITNNLYYSGPITESSIFAITTNLISMENEERFSNLNLHIQSQGGSLLPTFGLVDFIRTCDIPINTFVDSYCASAASLITVVGARRFINRHGLVLIHQLTMGMEPSKFVEIKDQTDNANTLMSLIKDIYLENTNLTPKKLDELLLHDWWLNSTLCKQYGIIDIIQ